MISNVEDYSDFLVKNNLTANQYLFCYCLGVGDYNSLIKYLKHHNIDSQDLGIDKLIIEGKLYPYKVNELEKGYNLRTLRLMDDFKNKIILDNDDASEELFFSYFDYLLIDGVRVPARNININTFKMEYSKIIKNNRLEHDRILAVTKKYVSSRPYAEMGLDKYIGTRHYNLVEKDDRINNVANAARFE